MIPPSNSPTQSSKISDLFLLTLRDEIKMTSLLNEIKNKNAVEWKLLCYPWHPGQSWNFKVRKDPRKSSFSFNRSSLRPRKIEWFATVTKENRDPKLEKKAFLPPQPMCFPPTTLRWDSCQELHHDLQSWRGCAQLHLPTSW